ncbi:serine hydrolase domain-containing protein [Nonomuraea rhodomycinica]|uniref:Beta-lactamase family protein n=1 Tax=Nonomuraea rhodomycinica TaxID=1712872 RepID=A0A7Y6IYL2_9ACTN|nr:serine hydrolase domain-containing protein [Nonomuraea rhodomycinica]NUW46515.1 beta-lactamase family protein [Nonomuraea rhodomycinica]
MSALVSAIGYREDEPLVAGIRRRGAPPLLLAQGLTFTGEPMTATTLVYAASLSKQMTAACAALLVRDGVLDMESPLSPWLPELPAWAGAVRLRHLVHHTAALPTDAEVDALIAGDADRTTAGVIRALTRFPALDRRPGAGYLYSNAGYVCLAAVVERAADMPLPAFARRHLFAPPAMADTRYWAGPGPMPPGAAPLARPRPAPLSLGDGGVWTTLGDLLRWGQALNADTFGVSELMQTPGRLDDGTPIDYAWGAGVRSHAGYRVYRHGGGWPGLRALHARVPALDLSVAVVATDDRTERRVPLLNGLLDVARDLASHSGGLRRRTGEPR